MTTKLPRSENRTNLETKACEKWSVGEMTAAIATLHSFYTSNTIQKRTQIQMTCISIRRIYHPLSFPDVSLHPYPSIEYAPKMSSVEETHDSLLKQSHHSSEPKMPNTRESPLAASFVISSPLCHKPIIIPATTASHPVPPLPPLRNNQATVCCSVTSSSLSPKPLSKAGRRGKFTPTVDLIIAGEVCAANAYIAAYGEITKRFGEAALKQN